MEGVLMSLRVMLACYRPWFHDKLRVLKSNTNAGVEDDESLSLSHLPNDDESLIPMFHNPAQRFLQRLTGLESLEVEFPTPDYLYPPNLWFRWFSLFDMDSHRLSYLSVHATIIPYHDHDHDYDNRSSTTLKHQLDVAKLLSWFHQRMCCLYEQWPGKLHTIVRKDARKNGRQVYYRTGCHYSSSNKNKFRTRLIICHVPATLVLNNGSLHIKDVSVFFSQWSDVDQSITAEELIMAFLGNTKDYQEAELREAVQKLFQHESIIVIDRTCI